MCAMNWWGALLIAAAGVPLGRALWANRTTSLMHAIGWAIAAWFAWISAAITGTATTQYMALALTACAGVAVLGARRPGAGPWNGVVSGLLAVLLLPLAQGALIGSEPIDAIRKIFLAVALTVGVMNYVPTRLAIGAAILLIAGDWAVLQPGRVEPLVYVGVGWAPWLAWLGLIFWPSAGWEGDRRWRDFRDRFGIVWGQRLREQFNAAAANAKLPIELRWRGFRRADGQPLNDADRAKTLELLNALTTRFGLP
jgi:hypothetical protein